MIRKNAKAQKRRNSLPVQLELPDKGRAIRGSVLCNGWYIYRRFVLVKWSDPRLLSTIPRGMIDLKTKTFSSHLRSCYLDGQCFNILSLKIISKMQGNSVRQFLQTSEKFFRKKLDLCQNLKSWN